MQFLVKHWFLVGVVVSILLARAAPEVGAKDGPLLPEYTVKYGAVSLIFMISGLSLRTQQLSAAVRNVPLHAFVQGFTLLFIPLLFYVLVVPGLTAVGLDVWLARGLMVVGCMPPPVSSAVILTKAVGGNEAAAIFNSAFGSFLGVFVTPVLLLLSVDVGTSGPGLDLNDFFFTLVSVFSQLSITVILPIGVGQLMRPTLAGWLERTKPPLSTLSQAALLLIIYTTFCDAFGSDALTEQSPISVAAVAAAIIMIQLAEMALVFSLCAARFTPPDVVCAIFCATHKSLTLGIPMLQIVFAGHAQLPLLSTPLLLYHPVQIVLGGVLVSAVRGWMLHAAEQQRVKLEARAEAV